MALGDLVIKLSADIASLQSDLGRANYIAQRRAEEMRRAFGVAASALAAIGAGFSLAGAVGEIRNLINAAADLDDLAEKTGASVEQLSRLTQQARISGVEFGVVETALIRLGKSLNADTEESKKATRALDALGLKAQDIVRMDTAQALRLVAERMSEFGDSSGKTALAMDLFGRSGAQVLPFLKDLANDMQAGITVTARQAAEAEELGKAWRRLTNDARIVAQALSLEIVPVLIDLIAKFNAARSATGGFITGLNAMGNLGRFGSTAAEQIKNIDTALRDLEKWKGVFKGAFISEGILGIRESALLDLRETARAFQRLEALKLGGDTPGERQRFGLSGAAKGPLDYATVATAAGRQLQETAGHFEDYAMRVQKAVAAAIHGSDVIKARELASAIEALDKLFFESGLEVEVYDAAMRKLTGTVDSFGDTTKAGAEKQKQLLQQVQEAQQLFDATRTPAERFGIEMERLNKLYAAGAVNLDTYNRGVQLAQDTLEKATKSTEDLKDVARELGMTFSSAFEDAIAGGKKFSEILRAIEQDIIRIITRKLVTEPAANWLTSKLGGGLGNLFGGGGIGYGAAGTAAGTAMVPTIGGGFVPALAEGTDFVPRDMLAFLHRGEAVVPKDQNTRAPITVINQFPPGTSRQTVDQAARETGFAVSQALRRNG